MNDPWRDRDGHPLAIGHTVSAYYQTSGNLIASGLTVIGFTESCVELRGSSYAGILRKYPNNVRRDVTSDWDLELDEGL